MNGWGEHKKVREKQESVQENLTSLKTYTMCCAVNITITPAALVKSAK